jgi:hypothetical protein
MSLNASEVVEQEDGAIATSAEPVATELKIAGKKISMTAHNLSRYADEYELRATGPSSKKWTAPTFHELVALIHQTYKGSYDNIVFEV